MPLPEICNDKQHNKFSILMHKSLHSRHSFVHLFKCWTFHSYYCCSQFFCKVEPVLCSQIRWMIMRLGHPYVLHSSIKWHRGSTAASWSLQFRTSQISKYYKSCLSHSKTSCFTNYKSTHRNTRLHEARIL